ncbi:MAG: hypothetical protein Fur0016_14560 [Anaerolineales bacterium]
MNDPSNQRNKKESLTLVQNLSKLVDQASEYFAHRKGLLPLLGILMIFINFLLVSLLPAEWFLIRTNLVLHLGLVTALFGILLAKAL